MSDLFGPEAGGVESVLGSGAGTAPEPRREPGARRVVSFRVVGVPQPQGSIRAFTPKGWTRPILTSDNPNLKDWRTIVAAAARDVATGELFADAVVLSLVFYLPRPKSAPRSVVYPSKRPDLSKLVRSTEDALKGVLWIDDSQVVDLLVRKRYATDGAPTGVFVSVEEAGAHFAKVLDR